MIDGYLDDDADGWDLFDAIPSVNRNQFAIGTRIDDRYEIVKEIRSGGMGVVYEVADRHWEQSPARALKTIKLRNAFLSDEQAKTRAEVLRRFKTEGEFQVKIRHDHVVRVYDQGEWQDEPYLVLDLIAGWLSDQDSHKVYLTLNDLLKGQGKLRPRIAVDILLQVSQALAEVHQQEIIHRDIKPENVFLDTNPGTKEFIVRLGDFGIARDNSSISHSEECGLAIQTTQSLVDTKAGDSEATRQVLGTPGYIAPELVMAANQQRSVAEATTTKCDIWSLGIMAYLLTKGEMPPRSWAAHFDWHPATETEVRAGEAKVVPTQLEFDHIQDGDLRQLLQRCVAISPEERPSASVLVEHLTHWKAGEPLPWTTRAKRWGLWTNKHRLQLSIIASLLIIAVTAGLYTWRLFTLNQTIVVQSLQARLIAANALEVTGQRMVGDGNWLSALPFLTDSYSERVELNRSNVPEVAFRAHSRLAAELRLSLIREATPRLLHLKKFRAERGTKAHFLPVPGFIGIDQGQSIGTDQDKPIIWDTNENTFTPLPFQTQLKYSMLIGDRQFAPIIEGGECALIDLATGDKSAAFPFPQQVGESVAVADLEILGLARSTNMLIVTAIDKQMAFLVWPESREVVGPLIQLDQNEPEPKAIEMSLVECADDGQTLLLAEHFPLLAPKPSRLPDYLWQGKRITACVLSPHTHSLLPFGIANPIGLAPNGEYLAGTDPSNLILTIYSARTSQKLASLPSGIYFRDLFFSEDSKTIFTVESTNGSTTLRRWSLANLQEGNIPQLIGNVQVAGEYNWDVSACKSGKIALAVSNEPGITSVHVFQEELRELCPPLPHAETINSIEFDGSSRYLLTSCSDGLVRVWDLITPLEQRLVPPTQEPGKDPSLDPKHGRLVDEHIEPKLHLKLFENDHKLSIVDETHNTSFPLTAATETNLGRIHTSGRWITADDGEATLIWSVQNPEAAPLRVDRVDTWDISNSGSLLARCEYGDASVSVGEWATGKTKTIDLSAVLDASSLGSNHLSISPDEKQLAFLADCSGEGSVLLVLDLDKSDKPILREQEPAFTYEETGWSPDSGWTYVRSLKQLHIRQVADPTAHYHWNIQELKQPQFLDGAEGIGLLLSGKDEYVLQLLGAPQQSSRSLQKQLNNISYISDLGILALQPGGFVNSGTIFDPRTNRLLLTLGRRWTSLQTPANMEFALIGSSDNAPTTFTTPISLLRLPSPKDLQSTDLQPSSPWSQLLSMTKVIDAGETKVINSSDAIGLWEQLPAAAGPPVSDAIIARWHRLTGLEYDPDLAIIERRNAELAYIARLTDNDANWCRLGIVQCRLDSYDAAIKTLARVKGRLIPKARCWAAIAYARGGNVEAAKKIVNELKHSDQAIDSRELALAEGAIAEESEDVEKALAHYREAQDMLWVKDWIVEASLKKHDYQAAYQAYAQLKLEQLTPERWRKFAWLCLAVKDFSSFVRACDFLEEHAKQTLDFQASYKALMVLALDVDKPKRHAWELNAWEQVAPEVDRHPAESAFRMLTLARETFIDLAKEDKLRELSLDENGDIDYRPLYAASLLDIAAMNPRHAPANTTLGELSSSFQKELLATKDFPADVVSRLNWEDQVLYHYLIESADETFASSTSQRANKLLENDQLQDAEKLCRDFYDAPEWSDVRHIAWKQEIGGVLALLLANGQDRQATSKVLQELEDSLSDQNYTPLFNMALAHCLVGGGPAYIAFCERLLKKYGNTDDPILANALGTVCALNPLPPTIDADLRRLNAVPQPGQSDFDNNRMQALLHIQTEEFELAREDLKLAEKHRLASDFKPFPIREAIVELSINPSSQEGIDRLTESIQLLEKHDQSKDQDGNRESWITRILYRRLIEWAQSLREK